MTLETNTARKIIGNDLLTNMLFHSDSINIEIVKLRNEREKLVDAIKEVDVKILYTQKRCEHYATIYHPDPSGNSDSYYECDICGATV